MIIINSPTPLNVKQFNALKDISNNIADMHHRPDCYKFKM